MSASATRRTIAMCVLCQSSTGHVRARRHEAQHCV